MTEPKPEAYKYCETHFVAKCPICKPGQAQPNPVNDQVASKASVADSTPSAGVVLSPPSTSATSEPLKVDDPAAQKAIDAAQEYANAIQAAITVADQVRQTKELLKGLESKHAELKKIAAEKLKITMEASS